MIKNLPGVEVAAPIANLGYTHVVGTLHVDLREYITGDVALLKVAPTYAAANGLARYEDASHYAYYTHNEFIDGPQRVTTIESDNGVERWPCWYFNVDPYGIGDAPQRPYRQRVDALPRGTSAFDDELRTTLECYSENSPTSGPAGVIEPPADFVGVSIPVSFPVLISAIDPEQEEALVGLEEAVSSGRYLRPNETPEEETVEGSTRRLVPALLSSKAFADISISMDVLRVDYGSPEDVRTRLDDGRARAWLTSRPTELVGSIELPLANVFEDVVGSFGLIFGMDSISVNPGLRSTWTLGPVEYQEDEDGELLMALEKPPQPPETWTSSDSLEQYVPLIPVDNQATQVRQVTAQQEGSCGQVCDIASPVVVGRFDPEQIAGFSSLSRVPLESYRAPEVLGADARSRTMLGDEPLRPDRNLGGYLRQPPALLTTLEGMEAILASRDEPGQQASLPISSIRVRVAGVSGVDELSRARVNAVVAQIKEQLGEAVEVEITVGASPAPQVVRLPAGLAGDESLLVEEHWAQKGVGIRIVEAINIKSAALFGLVLVVCSLYLAQGALGSVRARRTEIATLLALGWSRAETFAAVLIQLLVVGLVGGVLGFGIAWAAARLLSIEISSLHAALAVPVALAVAAMAGLVPAWFASRVAPVEALLPPVTPAHRARSVRSKLSLALTNVARTRGRTVLGVAGLALAVSALTALLAVTLTFEGQVTGSLLGNVVVADVRPIDYLAVGLSLALSAVALADVLVMSQRERSGEYATLVATGWSTREISIVSLYEGLVMTILGALAGALAGVGLSLVLSSSFLDGDVLIGLARGAALAGLGALLIVLVALLVPVARITRIAPASVLADE